MVAIYSIPARPVQGVPARSPSGSALVPPKVPTAKAFVSLVVPVYNEEKVLMGNISRLCSFLVATGYTFEIIIANNGSTDGTHQSALQLARRFREVRVMHLEQKGRGRALKEAWAKWSSSAANVLAYMDVDLSTDLEAFPALVDPLVEGGYDLAAGSRLLAPWRTERGLRREFISRAYNRLVKAAFRTRFSDAQCGFKAITATAAARLLPLVEDDGWFMDTELLVLAEKLGFRIFDLPVRWTESTDSRVKILSTAWQDLKGILRLLSNLANNRYRL